MRYFSSSRARRMKRGRLAIAAALVSCVAVVGVASAAVGGFDPFGTGQVGQTYANGVLLPTDQWISPLGARILDNNARLVSSTISPNGRYLAALGWRDFSGYLTIVDLKSGSIVSQTSLDSGTGSAEDSSVGPDGPLFSADGSTIWVPQSTWLDKFSFNQTTGAAAQTDKIALCGSALTDPKCDPNTGPSDPSGAWLPAGMALSPDGSSLYVALNGANALGVIDTQHDVLAKTIPVGNAPRQVVLADNGGVAYVSNEGGRPASGSEFTNLSDGTPLVANRSTGDASTGTVSVVNLTTGKEQQEIPVGLQPTALYQNRTTRCSWPTRTTTACRSSTRTATRSLRPCTPTRCPAPGSAATPTRSTCPIPTTCW